MRTPEDVLEMRRLQGLGWGTRRIAAQLGCSRTTVQVWLRRGRWRKPARRRRDGMLRGLEGWLRDRLAQHEGNADVVRQELEALGVRVSLRTVQRAVEPFRRELRAAVVATTRFETPPGYQLQIDFGQRRVWIGEEKRKVTLFVATLGCSLSMGVENVPLLGFENVPLFRGVRDRGGVVPSRSRRARTEGAKRPELRSRRELGLTGGPPLGQPALGRGSFSWGPGGAPGPVPCGPASGSCSPGC